MQKLINIKDVDKNSAYLHYTNKNNVNNIFKEGLLPKIGKNSKNIELNKKVSLNSSYPIFLIIFVNFLLKIVKRNLIKSLIK